MAKRKPMSELTKMLREIDRKNGLDEYALRKRYHDYTYNDAFYDGLTERCQYEGVRCGMRDRWYVYTLTEKGRAYLKDGPPPAPEVKA